MKKVISIILAAATLIAAVSCSVPRSSSGSSSDAASKYASRLPEGAVILVGDEAEANGVSVAGFSDDGYVIRREGGKVTVLAKTEHSLDLATRRYQRKYADGTEDFTLSAGEGYRVKSITLAGVDIREYAIVYPTGLGYGIWDETYAYAAERLATYIEKTCGALLPTFADDAPGYEHKITFVCDENAGLGGDGFEIATAPGQMTLTSAGRGAHFAVSEFLEAYIGWRFLTLEYSYLYEADNVDVPAGISDRQVPLFLHRAEYSDKHGNYPYDEALRGAEHCLDVKMVGSGTQSYAKYGYGTCYGETNHGYYVYIPSVPWSRQPCLTDNAILNECIDNIIDEVARKSETDPEYFEKQGGKHMIRLGHNDNDNFCKCKKCSKIAAEEGGFAGLNVRFCNDVEEAVNEEFDGRVIIGMFAYWGAPEPPRVTKPNDNVFVTYCVYQPCWNHPLGDLWCDPSNLGVDKLTNEKHLEFLRRWCEISPHVTIYFYGVSDTLEQSPLPMHFEQFYDDIRLMAEAGARGMMSYACDQSPLFGDLIDYLFSKLMWDPLMSREKYEAYRDEAIRLLYGEGDEAIKTLSYYYYQAKINTPCHVYTEDKTTNLAYIAARADEIERLCALALSGCESDWQQSEVEEFVSIFYYALVLGTRSDWESGDAAARAVYAARYAYCAELLAKRGVKLDPLPELSDETFIKDKTVFTLSSADSTLTVRLADDRLFVTSLSTDGGANLLAGGEYPLPDSYAVSEARDFNWKYRGAKALSFPDDENGKYGYAYFFEDTSAGASYRVEVTAHAALRGPFEFTGYLSQSLYSSYDVTPGEYFAVTTDGGDAPVAWSFEKEWGVAKGWRIYNGYGSGGTGLHKTEMGASSSLVVKNTASDGDIPMTYLDFGGERGVYAAVEWTNATISASSERGEGDVAVSVMLADSKKPFHTALQRGKELLLPTVYLGVYDGDVDDGSNVFKRWFLHAKAPAALLADANEPLTQEDYQHGLDVAKYGVQSVKWDYGWWSDEQIEDTFYRTNEGLLEVNAHEYLDAMRSVVGSTDLADFTAAANEKGLTVALYMLLKDTALERDGVPTSVGADAHPAWFSNRIISTGFSADLGNEECVEFYKRYIGDFMRANGVTTWRSDFEPICVSSDKQNRHYANGSDVQYWCSVGFYDLVDSLYETLGSAFRYESCSSGGQMKDFSTLRRAVVLNCDDSADYMSLKMSFYDSSYCVHPAQLQLPTNALTYYEDSPYYTGSADLDFGMRSQLEGAAMLSNRDGTSETDIALWEKYLPVYNARVKPLMKYGDLYHVLPRPDGVHWDGIEYFDPEASGEVKGMLMIFKPSDEEGATKVVKLRGLDPETTYRVEFDDHPELNVTATGRELSETGLTVTFTESVASDWVWIKT